MFKGRSLGSRRFSQHTAPLQFKCVIPLPVMGKLRPREASIMLKVTEQGSGRVGSKSNQISLMAAMENPPCSACSLFPGLVVGGLSLLRLQPTFSAHLVFYARRLMVPEVHGSCLVRRTCSDESGLLFHL